MIHQRPALIKEPVESRVVQWSGSDKPLAPFDHQTVKKHNGRHRSYLSVEGCRVRFHGSSVHLPLYRAARFYLSTHS
jgi:hypothetical protein